MNPCGCGMTMCRSGWPEQAEGESDRDYADRMRRDHGISERQYGAVLVQGREAEAGL